MQNVKKKQKQKKTKKKKKKKNTHTHTQKKKKDSSGTCLVSAASVHFTHFVNCLCVAFFFINFSIFSNQLYGPIEFHATALISTLSALI